MMNCNKEKLSLLLLSVLTFFQCQTNAPMESSNAQTVEAVDSSNNQEVLRGMDIKFAQNFSITNHKNYKIAHLHYQSKKRGIDFNQKIILLPKGNSQPHLSKDLQNAWLLEVPVQTVAANEDGEITRLKISTNLLAPLSFE